MYQIVLYLNRLEEKLVGRPKQYMKAFQKFERLSAKYPDRRYAIRKV
jgi:hypothetical protein